MKNKLIRLAASSLALAALTLSLPLSSLHAESTPAKKEVTVFAAASLVNAFKDVAKKFQAVHPDAKLTFNFAGSQQLRAQVEQGATPDVFASANLDEIKSLVSKKYVNETDSKVFAKNKLVVVVSAQSDKPVKTLKDLSKPGLKLVLADATVPVGKYTVKFLDAASKEADFGTGYKEAVLKNVVSYETNVRAVLTKVALGEADAGIVYSTDAKSVEPGKTYAISLPAALDQIAQYPIAPLAKAPNKELAKAFVDFVLSPEGKHILSKYGFIE
jgi:molybdate transport system substrate-binding protein